MNAPTSSNPPLVSVCIDVFNYAEFVSDAIESVMSQTLTDWELIIVDDQSTDASFSIAQEYARKDQRIRVIRNPVNLGMVRNRNRCLQEAQGKYIKCLHADDFLARPDALQKMVDIMEANSGLCLVSATMQFVDRNSRPVKQIRQFKSSRFLAGTTVITQCLWQQKNLIGGPSAVMFRREQASRGFDENYFHAADLEMWFHLLEKGAFAYLPEALTAFRFHENQQTEKDRQTLSAAQDRQRLLQTYLCKKEIRLRGWVKTFLKHQALDRLVKQGRALGQSEMVRQAIRDYGSIRYFLQIPGCATWHCSRQIKPIANLVAPFFPSDTARVSSNHPDSRPMGINIAGMVKGEYGIGESSRAFCRAIEQSGIPHCIQNIHAKSHRNQDDSIRALASENPYAVNLMTFSFDYARRFYLDKGRRFFKDRYNIALWYWELENFPSRFHANFDYYDEIWAPTEFCRRAFAEVSPIPVHKITYPLGQTTMPKPDRAKFNLPEDVCLFLFSFDYCSTIARKNPLAVIAAFKQAFARTDKAVLIIKAINPEDDPTGAKRVRDALLQVNGVLIESHLTGADMNILLATCDCYVSLHRSEGLGLGMAQAMNFAKPVIATGYSGNMEFMNPDNSLLVPYKLVANPSAVASYEQGCIWAEADINAAADQMQWVYSNRSEASQMGQRAQQKIQANLDPARTILQIKSRLREISGQTIAPVIGPIQSHSPAPIL